MLDIPILQVAITNILLDVEDGVIVTDKALDAVAKELDVVLLPVESVAVITCNTLPNEPLADRINPVILDAFKQNPYSQSLSSWA